MTAEEFVPRERQRQVLRRVCLGWSNKQIAEDLHVGIDDIEYHVGALLRATGCVNRANLAAWAVERGYGNSREEPPREEPQ